MFWVLIETFLLSTHNLCFGLEARKLVFNYSLISRGLRFSVFCNSIIYRNHHLHDLYVTLCLLVQSADNLCKQFEPRSGLIKCGPRSDGIPEILKEFFKNFDFEKNSRRQKNHENYPACKEFSHEGKYQLMFII